MKNCALIEELRLSLDRNLNILTGETGAGKSIIIDALNLCLGSKYDRSFLRKGTDKGLIEIVFYTENQKVIDFLEESEIDVEDDNLIIVSRVIFSDGKSSARVNGRTVKISSLKHITGMMVDVHGQHQNNALLDTETHIEFLDLFGGDYLDKYKKDYRKTYNKYSEVRKSLNILNENKDDMQIQREIDLLNFQINEISSANLNEGEYQELLQTREIYRNSEKIYNKLNLCYEGIHNGEINVVDLIGIVSKELYDIAEYDVKLEEFSNDIERIMYELQDISSGIRDYKEHINFEPYVLEQIEIRINEINNLRRKYGDTIEDILKFYDKTVHRLDEIINRDEKVEELKKELTSLEEELTLKATELTLARKELAIKLEKLLLVELESLNMKHVSFRVKFTEGEFTYDGKDNVEFMVSFNLGEDMKPINKVASGGEMSRFMLAFKTILADIDGTDTLVFDEIDTGISGVAAQIVGEKLANISIKKQIVCITHLPQIAANATTHFCIEKNVHNYRTFTNIKKLNENTRVEEIARLISGSKITEKTIDHANEIIEIAKQ